MSDDLELETFLRQFRPVAPPPLRRPRTAGRWWVPAAIAASVVLALFAIRPPARPPQAVPEGPPRATLGALGHAVRAGTYESALDALDARVLPDPAREGGTLRALADVSRDWR
jgi:hypothetical protein